MVLKVLGETQALRERRVLPVLRGQVSLVLLVRRDSMD